MNLSFSSEKEFIAKLSEMVLANLGDENFGVEQLVEKSGLSSSVIRHRLKTISKKTISQFINEVRLQKALEMLQQSNTTASEVAYKVGFSSPNYFSNCFHEHFGYPPGEAKKRFLENQMELGSIKHSENKKDVKVHFKSGKKIKRTWKTIIYTVLGTVVFFVLSWFGYSYFISGKPLVPFEKQEKSIVVLPFKNLSDNEENQHFADGIMEDILNHLNSMSELRVISRTSAERYRESTKSAPEIARELGVNFILEGSIQVVQDKVKIMIQLIDAKRDEHLFSEKIEKEMTDIFVVESSIAEQVADKLQATLSSKEIEKIKKIPTTNTEAYNAYLMGRFTWNKRTEEGVNKSLEYFHKAVSLDSAYALAWAGLADGYFIAAWWGWYFPKKEGYSKAKKYALKALEIDENLCEAHTVLGALFTWVDWNWVNAENELTCAIKLNPNYSTAHQYYAELLDILGENDKARKEINIAIKLEPHAPVKHGISQLMYYNEGSFELALKEGQEILSLEKNYISSYMKNFQIYFRMKDGEKALDELQKLFMLNSQTTEYVQLAENVYQKSGLDGLIEWLIEIKIVHPQHCFGSLADLYALAKKKDEALACLEKDLKENKNEICRLINNRNLDILRDDPRFLAMIDELGLTEYYSRKLKQ